MKKLVISTIAVFILTIGHTPSTEALRDLMSSSNTADLLANLLDVVAWTNVNNTEIPEPTFKEIDDRSLKRAFEKLSSRYVKNVENSRKYLNDYSGRIQKLRSALRTIRKDTSSCANDARSIIKVSFDNIEDASRNILLEMQKSVSQRIDCVLLDPIASTACITGVMNSLPDISKYYLSNDVDKAAQMADNCKS